MLPEVTYDDYNAYGGRLGGDDFNASLPAAKAAVKYVMGFNEPETEVQREAYVRAVCAAIDVDNAYGATGGVGEGLASVSIGSFSASAGTAGGSSATAYDIDMRRAVYHELACTGLLYQGIA